MGQGLYRNYVFLPPESSYRIGERVNGLEFTTFTYGSRVVPFALARAGGGAKYEDYCLLYSHGNAEDLGHISALMVDLAFHLGVAVACYEYEGYGPFQMEEPHRTPSEELCYENIAGAFNHLRHEYRFDSSKILLFGRSLGSGPTVHLASVLSNSRIPFAGVVLQSPFTSAVGVLSHALSYLTVDMFENFKKLPQVLRPIVFIHGQADTIVSYEHTLKLVALVREASPPEESRIFRCQLLPTADHNDIEASHWDEFLITLSDFLQHLNHETFHFFQPSTPLVPPHLCVSPASSSFSCFSQTAL